MTDLEYSAYWRAVIKLSDRRDAAREHADRNFHRSLRRARGRADSPECRAAWDIRAARVDRIWAAWARADETLRSNARNGVFPVARTLHR